VGEILGGERDKEEPEEEIVLLGATVAAAAATVGEDKAGSRRFPLGTMSPPTIILVFPLEIKCS